jgi:hypothetical protein
MLLSDGSVMIHTGGGGVTNTWAKLSPVNGSYANGTFSSLPSMSLQRLYFASNVLPSGKVMVLGGEYSGPSGTANWINTGEIYDPVANSWSAMPNFPQSQFGDDPSIVLPNGNVLCGYLSGGQTYIYNPTANTWAATGSKVRSDRSDEETWIKLPDDSILSYDVFGSTGTVGHAQRYIPSTGTWVDAGNLPAPLSSSSQGFELGPAFLLPDGRAYFAGANGNNAIYTPSTNTWAAAGQIISGGVTYVMADAPGAMMPNGHVLLAVSPLGTSDKNGYTFPGPTKVFEYDPTLDSYTDVTPSLSGFDLGNPSFITTMLMLPTGQVMMCNDSSKIALFTPNGSPNAAWRPVITNITNNGSGTFTLTGTQLNGISEGASYGDDAEMSTNYPIVQLTDNLGNVKFARTFNWSSTGVATGSLVETVQFTLPAGTNPNAFLVNSIASGIASLSVLNVQIGAATTSAVTIQADANPANVDVVTGTSGIVGTFALASFNGLIVSGDSANDAITLNVNLGGRAITINNGSGTDVVNLEANGGATTINGGGGINTFNLSPVAQNLADVSGLVTINAGAGSGSVVASDNNSGVAATYAVGTTGVTRAGFGGLAYGVGLTALTINAGAFADALNVTGSPMGMRIMLNSGAGDDAIVIGVAGGNLSALGGTVWIDGQGGVNDSLTINDRADQNFAVSRTPAVFDAFWETDGATIIHEVFYANIESLALNTGGGGSGKTLDIDGTVTPITLDNGDGSNTINVNHTLPGAPVTIVPSAGNDPVNVDTAGTGGAAVVFAASQKIGVLTIGPGGSAAVSTGAKKLLETTGISITGTGVLDLNANDLIVHGGNAATTFNLIQTGFNGGQWTGGGIASSAAAADALHLMALGMLQTSTAGSFDGQPVTAGDILVKYTYYGDADLSGKVDGTDYTLIDHGFNSAGTFSGWMNGDFNYDGHIDGTDYSLIDNAFNFQRTTITFPSALAAATIQPTAPVAQPPFTPTPAVKTLLTPVSQTIFNDVLRKKKPGLSTHSVYSELNGLV